MSGTPEPIETARARYDAAAHAMQTGVAIEHEHGSKDGTPKHLRVGVNSAQVSAAALATLLIERGVFTLEDYTSACADAMEREADEYRERVRGLLGPNVSLR